MFDGKKKDSIVCEQSDFEEPILKSNFYRIFEET